MNSCSFGEHEDGGENAKEEQLESTRIKIGEAREENQRLKKVLEGMIKDYQSLQMHFFNIAQHEQVDKTVEKSMNPLNVEEPEFVTLSLGKTSNEIKIEEAEGRKIQDDGEREGLDLVLMECKVQNSINASNEEADEEGRVCETSKVVKNPRSDQADEVALHANAKRARVSVRARCDAPTMSDGGQWRKYGQKVSKGNPCPRAYYRCTVAPACPVKKQVQRCLQDMSILITTYEGTHNHPLPVSAAAMASTTSAAASMLTSGPLSSRPATGMFSLASTAAAANHNLQILNQNQVYISNQASSSSSHPTITLDLTTPSRYSPTRFNFPTFESNQRYRHGSAISARNLPPQHNPSTADTIAKAIMTDQSFRSMLMAAISSYVTNNGTQGSSTLQNLNHFHTLGSSHDQEDNERA